MRPPTQADIGREFLSPEGYGAKNVKDRARFRLTGVTINVPNPKIPDQDKFSVKFKWLEGMYACLNHDDKAGDQWWDKVIDVPNATPHATPVSPGAYAGGEWRRKPTEGLSDLDIEAIVYASYRTKR